MPSLPFLYGDFQGGFNSRTGPFLLDSTSIIQARDLNNVQGTTAGAIVKRGGLVTFASPAVTLTSLYPYEATSPNYLIGAGGTSLYSVSTAGAVATLKTALTNNLRWEFVQAPVVSGQGPLFGMDGTDTPQQWNGSAASTSNWTNATGAVAVPNGKYCVYAGNQVYVAGVAATPSRVFVSAISDPTNWDPASNTGAVFIDFDPSDGEPITGLGLVGPYVMVCKARKLFLIVQPGNAAVATVTRRLSTNIGCVAHRSIASDATGTYFLAEDRGVYVTNGSKLTPISDNIQPTLDGIAGSRSNAVGGCFAGHYYLSIPAASAANDTTVDYDSTLGSWWKHTFGSNQFAVFHPSGTAQLYSAKATAAIVDQAFVAGTFTDNGANFTWSWTGPWQSPTFYRRRRFPTPYFRKNLRQVRFDGQGQVDFSLAKDYSGAPVLLHSNIFNYNPAADVFGGSGTYGADDGTLFGGAPSIGRNRFFSLGVANAFSVVLSGTNGSTASIYEYVMMLSDRKDLVVS